MRKGIYSHQWLEEPARKTWPLPFCHLLVGTLPFGTNARVLEGLQAFLALTPSMSWIHGLGTKESLGWARKPQQPASAPSSPVQHALSHSPAHVGLGEGSGTTRTKAGVKGRRPPFAIPQPTGSVDRAGISSVYIVFTSYESCCDNSLITEAE